MSLEVTRLTQAEFEEQVDFINLVFSQNSVPHDFKHLMPRWIRPELAEYNVIVKRDGKIRANIMAAPVDIHMAGHKLRGYGLGNVSTHLEERRQGLMRMAMTRVLADAQADSADLIFLGGQRQRYGYYGFERCGIRYSCTIDARNFKHARIDAPVYSFSPLTGPEDLALAEIRKLYDAEPVRIDRGEDLWLFLNMWKNIPWGCRNAAGDFVGYLCAGASGEGIAELCAVDEALMLGMLQGWYDGQGLQKISFTVAPWRRTFLRDTARIADSVNATPDHQYRILHWDRVIQALLDVKAGYAPLADGEVVLEIGAWGNLGMRVSGGKPECARTDRPADVKLTEFEAMRTLLGPNAPGCSAVLPDKVEMTLRAWCPLPLSWHSQDNV